MQKARKTGKSNPGRVLGRVLAEDLRNVSAGELGLTAIFFRDENGTAWITNREWDHD